MLMNRITIPFSLNKGQQTPILASTLDQHVLVGFSNSQGLSMIPEEVIRRLRLFPVGMERDADGSPMPRYLLAEVSIIPDDGPALSIKNLRLYRDPDPQSTMITLGNRVVSTVAFIPPLNSSDLV